jgi:hypothetical protein
VDVVYCWKWDRFIREPLDLEYLIPRFDKAGVRFAEADGIIDLGTDSGRLAARILVAVAKAEQERKSERQKLANETAAVAGKRRLGTPRPFGYDEDRVTAHPADGPAVAEACALLLGGGTLSAIMRGWSAAGLRPAQSKAGRWTRSSIREILLNPRNAGLSVYHGEIVGDRDVGAAGERGDMAGGTGHPSKTLRGSRQGGCGRSWAAWRCARAETWCRGCRHIPAAMCTAALQLPVTWPGRAGMCPSSRHRWRSSLSSWSSPACPVPMPRT